MSESSTGVFIPVSMTSSEIAGMLLRLIVSAREIKVTAKVALRSGSSQHGKARLAAVGYVEEEVR